MNLIEEMPKTDSEVQQEMGASMKADFSPRPEYREQLVDKLYEMKYLKRFAAHPLIHENNLAEHCYNTGNLFVEIARAEELYVTKEDIIFVFRHDVLETVTGDVLRPAKEFSPTIKDHWDSIEKELVAWFTYLEDYTDSKAEEIMSKDALQLFKECDLLDIYITMYREYAMGNTYAKIVEIVTRVQKILLGSKFSTVRKIVASIPTKFCGFVNTAL